MLPWMAIALPLNGTKEVLGSESNKKILEWAALIGGDVARDYKTDATAWCGLFTGYCVSQSGYDIPEKPLWALNWRASGWASGTKVEPAYGAVMTFQRDGGGHVAFYISEDDNFYYILGGNQSDSVNTMKIAKTRFKGASWPTDALHLYQPGAIERTLNVDLSTNER